VDDDNDDNNKIYNKINSQIIEKQNNVTNYEYDELARFLENCEFVNNKERINSIFECRAFFDEDLDQCDLLVDDVVERCKSSILTYQGFVKLVNDKSCDDLDADIFWCKAIKTNNLNFCDHIVDEKSMIFCKSKISGNINLCDQINTSTECMDIYNYLKAFDSNDGSFCDVISYLSLKNACNMNILNLDKIDKISYGFMERKLYVLFSAFLFKSSNLCFDLEESDVRAMCFALTNLDVEECENALNTNYCDNFFGKNIDFYKQCLEQEQKSLCVSEIVNSSSY